ncbi:MAG: lysophospholipid acyltransferase family protein [Saccharofermentanales bacterium]
MIHTKKAKPENPKEYGSRPFHLLYAFCVYVMRLYAKLFLNVRWNIDPAIFKLDKPMIVISNHPSYFDPFLAACAVYPIEVNFLAADNYFRRPVTRWLIAKVGAIPKIQFRADPRAMKAMIKVIKRQGVLGIFPEGTRSIHGRQMPIEETFTKFIKKMEVNVVCLNSKGAYMTWPRWSLSGYRRGRITIDATVLATGVEIHGSSLSDLHERIIAALRFDDYKSQKSDPVIYRSKAPAYGLHNILHQCPRCGGMWVMDTSAYSLFCTACGNAAMMDLYGFMAPKDSSCVIFETVSEWNDWQFNNLKPLVAAKGFALEDHAVMQTSPSESVFVTAGKGTIRLTRTEFVFIPDRPDIESDPDEGTADNAESERAAQVLFPISGIWGISSDYGVYFDLFKEKDTFRFVLDHGQKALSFSHALDIIRKE